MKNHSWLVTVVLGMMVSASAVAAPPTGPDFKAIMQKELDAWSTLDTDKAAVFYDKDPSDVFYDISPLKYTGWVEYAAGVKKEFPDAASIKFTMNDDVRTHQQGNFAWATGTVHAVMTTKGGAQEPLDARWTVVWQKHGKDWLIVHEHFSAAAPETSNTAGASLYKRLGGYDALAAVTDDFIGRLAHDPQLGKFFVGHSTDSLKRIRQLVVDQLCEATGGPCVYIGRSMKVSHAGMGISESDWNTAAGHLVETLNKFNVPQKEKDEVLGAISGMKADIVTAGGH